MRTPTAKTKSLPNLKLLIRTTTKLWRKYHLTYDQARYVTKEVRKALGVKRLKVRKRTIQRLSRDEEQRLIQRAYRDKGEHGLLIKTLFQTGARVSEFVNVKVEDFFLDEAMILITKGKGRLARLRPPHQEEECRNRTRGWEVVKQAAPPRHADSLAPGYRRFRALRLRAGGRPRRATTPPSR